MMGPEAAFVTVVKLLTIIGVFLLVTFSIMDKEDAKKYQGTIFNRDK